MGGFLGAAGFCGSGFGCWLAASFASPAVGMSPAAPGFTNWRSSSVTFASIRSHAYWALFAVGVSFAPMATAKGKYTPLTGL